MDIKRAKEITTLPDMVDVTYNGDLIYIENVNPDKNTASIHALDHPSNSREVHVTQLVESRMK